MAPASMQQADESLPRFCEIRNVSPLAMSVISMRGRPLASRDECCRRPPTATPCPRRESTKPASSASTSPPSGYATTPKAGRSFFGEGDAGLALEFIDRDAFGFFEQSEPAIACLVDLEDGQIGDDQINHALAGQRQGAGRQDL